MRTGIYLTLLFIIGFLSANAQKPIKLTDESVQFGSTMCPGVWVDIPEVDLETIRKSWTKIVEKGTKSKAVVAGNEISIFGAIINDVSESPINIFSAVLGQDSIVRLFTALELSRDQFTEVNSKEHEQLKSILKQFAKEQYTEVAEKQLSAEESKLKDLEKELSSLRKEKEKFEKDIQSANTSISEENYKIATVQKEMAVTDATLDAKSTDLSTTNDADAKKSIKSEVKSLQKKKKSHLNDISSSENKISKSNNTIQDNNNNISVNLRKQEEISNKINSQKLEVSKYTNKLKTIESY